MSRHVTSQSRPNRMLIFFSSKESQDFTFLWKSLFTKEFYLWRKSSQYQLPRMSWKISLRTEKRVKITTVRAGFTSTIQLSGNFSDWVAEVENQSQTKKIQKEQNQKDKAKKKRKYGTMEEEKEEESKTISLIFPRSAFKLAETTNVSEIFICMSNDIQSMTAAKKWCESFSSFKDRKTDLIKPLNCVCVLFQTYYNFLSDSLPANVFMWGKSKPKFRSKRCALSIENFLTTNWVLMIGGCGLYRYGSPWSSKKLHEVAAPKQIRTLFPLVLDSRHLDLDLENGIMEEEEMVKLWTQALNFEVIDLTL